MKFLEDKCWSDPLDTQQQESTNLSNLPLRLPKLEVQHPEETPTDSPCYGENFLWLGVPQQTE